MPTARTLATARATCRLGPRVVAKGPTVRTTAAFLPAGRPVRATRAGIPDAFIRQDVSHGVGASSFGLVRTRGRPSLAVAA